MSRMATTPLYSTRSHLHDLSGSSHIESRPSQPERADMLASRIEAGPFADLIRRIQAGCCKMFLGRLGCDPNLASRIPAQNAANPSFDSLTHAAPRQP